MLYQNQIDPRLAGPYMQQLQNRYGNFGQAQGNAASAPQTPQATQVMQSPGVSSGMNPMQNLNTGMKLYNQFAGGSSGSGSGAQPGMSLMNLLSGDSTTGLGTMSEGAASGLGEGAAGGWEGALGGMGAGSMWMLPVAAAATMSGISMWGDGEDPGHVFGSKGWGGYPFQIGEAIGDGDWRTATGRTMQMGGIGPSAMIGTAIEGGNSDDWLRSVLGVVPDVWDYFTGDDDDTIDLIQLFANPNGNYQRR